MNARRLASAVLVLVSVIAVTSAAVESTAQTPATIAEIQGASHISPLDGESVNGVEGVVTSRRTAGGRGVWIQDPTPDADIATSDGYLSSSTPRRSPRSVIWWESSGR